MAPTTRTTAESRYSVAWNGDRLALVGDLATEDAAAIWRRLRKETGKKRGGLTIDLSQVASMDGGVMALVVALRAELAQRGAQVEIAPAPEHVEPLVELYGGRKPPERHKPRKPESTIAQIGRTTVTYLHELKEVVGFLGLMVVSLVGIVKNPRSGHLKEVPPLVERTGADAVPIVVLINFLVGFVMAYQSAKQLKMFGANIFVADLVGLSVTRELAPLMTAIIVAGRSGAAFAAEIGSMKVGEELDALRTIGLRPFAWLVVPRTLALLIVTPFLTLIADLVGVLGGLVVGVTSLDLTAQGYLIETKKAVELWDVQHGVIKSFAFALAISLIACQQGFSASGGAEGVGRRTTSTVVTCLFALVLIDALFTIVFRMFDL